MSGSRDYGTTLRASLALLTGGIGGRPDMLAKMSERRVCRLEESVIRVEYFRAPFYRILQIRSACGNIGDGYSVSQRTAAGNKALKRLFRERYGNGSAIIGIIQTAAVFDIAYREGSGLYSKRQLELSVGTDRAFYDRTGT